MVVGRKKVDPTAGQAEVVPPLLDGRCLSHQEGRRGPQGSFPEPRGGVKERIHVQHPRHCPASRAQPPNHGALSRPCPGTARFTGSEGSRLRAWATRPPRPSRCHLPMALLHTCCSGEGILVRHFLLLMLVLLGPIMCPY